MTLAKYQELTGTTVSAADTAKVTATLNRVQRMLETMLGFTLDPTLVNQNLYTETGKTPTDWCPCPNVEMGNLLPPDPVVFAYRLYPYNRLDKFLSVDPFSAVHAVKLVKDGVTLRTFLPEEFRVDIGRDGWAKFFELCRTCRCTPTCTNCAQLAVDATWLWDDEDDIPDDLLYVWADMVTFYGNENFGVKSQTLGTHSYTLFDNVAPQDKSENIAVLMRYAGPFGSLARTVTL